MPLFRGGKLSGIRREEGGGVGSKRQIDGDRLLDSPNNLEGSVVGVQLN